MSETHSYERWNRFELKYLLHYQQARAFVRILSSQVDVDRHADRGGFYKVVSLYYDSADLKCYWEKLDGERWRRKLRIRTYGDRPESAFVEIKGRLDQSVQKRRTVLPIATWAETMAAVERGRHEAGVDPVLDEAAYLVHAVRLEPKLVVSYNRVAFFDRYKKDVRVTVDRNIRCRDIGLSLTEHRTGGRFLIPPTFVIVEVKFNHTIPLWLCTALNRLGAQVQRISKYCAGIEACGLESRVSGPRRRLGAVSVPGAAAR